MAAAAHEEEPPAPQAHLDALFGQFEEKDLITEFPKFQNVMVAKEGAGILSNVRQERIMARRARIEKQLMKNNRDGLADGQGANTLDNKNTGRMPSFTPVLESVKNLRRTFLRNEQTLDGYLKGTCRRRVYRHQAVTDHFTALDKRLASHRETTNSKLNAKMKKYGEMADQTLGLDELTMLFEKYDKYGKEFVTSKQLFVDEIEDEVKSLDDNFARMLRSFQKDMDAIRKKATEMTTKMTNICRREIYDLDKTFAGLESEYIRNLNALWEKGHSDVRTRDDAIMMQREEFMEEMLNNMKALRTTKLDSYLEVKLTLDNDVLLMTEQLQNMRASFLVNAEKLDYNLEVIQLREEESMKTKNKQKRIITKIQDEVARTTNELRTDERRTRNKLSKHKSEYIDMTTELVQLHQTYDEAAGKDWSTFRDSWISNELALRDSFKTLLLLDRFITEEICHYKWECPSLWMLGHIGPIHGLKWRAQVERYKQELRRVGEADDDGRLLRRRLAKEHSIYWGILNGRTKRLATFRRMSLVRRPHVPLKANTVVVDPDGLEVETDPIHAHDAIPSHLVGPVLRWIVQHFDFLSEDYTVDVVNQLTWQDAFCFQIQAFLDHFKHFNYDDLCELALFFVRFSIKSNEAAAVGETVTDENITEWLQNLSPQEFLGRRITFNDVLLALHAYDEFKREEQQQLHAFDLAKSKGRNRDVTSDLDYLRQYTEIFDLDKKARNWRQLLVGMEKEATNSENKLIMTAQKRRLMEGNAKLKQLLTSHLRCEDDILFVYPPLWNKMHIVAHELSNNIRKPIQFQKHLSAARKPANRTLVHELHLTKSGMLNATVENRHGMMVNGIQVT